MIRLISIILFFTFAVSNSFAQTEKNSAPIDWQRYAVAPHEVSVLLPKMPIALYSSDLCNEKETRSYYAYADEIVYSLAITAKTKQKAPSYCFKRGKFTADNFVKRIEQVRENSQIISEEKFLHDGGEVITLTLAHSKLWLFNDLDNKRWFELSVHYRKNAEVNAKAFVESISIKKNPDGIEIGKGSERVLGDEITTEKNSTDKAEKAQTEEEIHPLNIITKPRPLYTDEARQANIQGTLTLRVTFLANGGIGAVTPVSQLSHGLTEQAVAAAKKMAFLPQKRGSQSINVVKSVQFSFSIY